MVMRNLHGGAGRRLDSPTKTIVQVSAVAMKIPEPGL